MNVSVLWLFYCCSCLGGRAYCLTTTPTTNANNDAQQQKQQQEPLRKLSLRYFSKQAIAAATAAGEQRVRKNHTVDHNTRTPQQSEQEEEEEVVEKECGIPAFCNLQSTRWGIPVILISQGRSGSQSLWTTLEGLFLEQQDKDDSDKPIIIMGVNEDVGMDRQQIQAFMQRNQRQHKCWLVRLFCRYQQANALAGLHPAIYGTKWKPYFPGFNMTAARDAFTWMGSGGRTAATMKVIFNQRNPLDVLLSKVKHQNNNRQTKLPAHCKPHQTSCFKRHEDAANRTVLNLDTLLDDLQRIVTTNQRALRILRELKVPHFQVSYETLFYGIEEARNEWQRMADFVGLGGGRPTIITQQDLEKATLIAPTSDYRLSHHRVVANYKEVAELLRGTQYEEYIKD